MRDVIYSAAHRNTVAVVNLAPAKHTRAAFYGRLACGVVLAALSGSAVAQTHFCIAGDLDRMSSTAVAACQARMSGVRQMVRQRGAPADWHFVVVCDEAGWRDYASLTGAGSRKRVNAAFHTDSELRWTFIRGSRLDAAGTPLPSSLPADTSPEDQLPPARPAGSNAVPLVAEHAPPAMPQPVPPSAEQVILASNISAQNDPFVP